MKSNLDILIPTYNRAAFLDKNVRMLDEYCNELRILDCVTIIISDNASTDDTVNIVNGLKSELKVKITFLRNENNLGLEKNALKVLEAAKAKYVMYLGDDDYIDLQYLKKIMEAIENEKKDISCIIPSFRVVDIHGELMSSGGRDLYEKTNCYSKGYKTAAKFLYRGHQLSGVTFLRKNTLEAYTNDCVSNIYLFMFFVGFNALRGNVYHLTDYPVLVTSPGKGKKDWSYGTDGLINERFKNSYSIFKGKFYTRYIAEYQLINNSNKRFLFIYWNQGIKRFVMYIVTTLTSKYLSIIGKLLFIITSISASFRQVMKNIVK